LLGGAKNLLMHYFGGDDVEELAGTQRHTASGTRSPPAISPEPQGG